MHTKNVHNGNVVHTVYTICIQKVYYQCSNFGKGGPTKLSALCLDEVQNQKSSLGFSMYPQWKTKRPCTDSRTCASLAELNGLLYYIGGWREDENSCNTVECYNPEIDEWVFCASLNTSRSRSGCVVGNDHIYIIGGQTVRTPLNSGSLLSSVERFVWVTKKFLIYFLQ